MPAQKIDGAVGCMNEERSNDKLTEQKIRKSIIVGGKKLHYVHVKPFI